MNARRVGPPASTPSPSVAQPETPPVSVATAIASEEETPGTRQQQRYVRWLEPLFDGAILVLYAVVGLLLLPLAFIVVGYALWHLPSQWGSGLPTGIITLLSELLFALILLEIARTIMTFITTRTTSIRPFLTVVVISSVRRVLSVSGKLSLVEDVPDREFARAMIELGVEGGLILAAALALFLLSRREGG